ncbi:MAG: hypothetical protein ACMG5Z_06800 [Luteimonas sp.]
MFRIRLVAALALALAMPAAFAEGQAAVGQDVEKVNGGITAEPDQSYGNLETVNGGIHIESRAHTGNAETVNGGIHVADRAQTGSLSTVNGGIHLGTQVQVSKDMETVNGEIFIDRGGRIGGDISTVNGGIGLVDTDVDGGISTVSGDVTVGVGSHVKGGLKVEKPNSNWSIHFGKPRIQRIVIGPNAVVEGPLVFEREVKLYVHASARTGAVTGATAIRFDGAHAPQD